MRSLDVDLTAVVTVADDGGSSGRLRRDMAGVLPPGDLRMALAALAADDETGRLWGDTFQHRFSGEGALAGHPVGNLVLVGLAQVLGDPVAALDAAGRMLGARGRVLPMACTPLDLVAEVTGLDEDPRAVRRIRGQVAVAATPGQVQSVALEPTDVRACAEGDRRGRAGGPDHPGSRFVVHQRAAASAASRPGRGDRRTPRAARVVVLNLAPQPGETEGFSPEQHLDVLSAHVPGLRIDTVLADAGAVPLPQRLATAAARLGARLDLAEVAADGDGQRHDPAALAVALRAVLDRVIGGPNERRRTGDRRDGDDR